MRTPGIVMAVALCLAAQAPLLAAVNASGIGAGLSVGTVDSDGADEIDFDGATAYLRLAITDRWGVLLSYREMEDDEDLFLGEEDEYTEIAIHMIRMWRPDKVIRPHVKFGLARIDFDAEIAGLLSFSDDDTGLSVGGGLEVGSQRVALFGDYEITLVELFDEDFRIDNLTAGIMFKF